MSNEKTLGECLNLLAGTYGVELDELMVEGYRIGLHGVPGDAIKRAVTRVLQDGKRQYMPRPGELRELALTDGVSVESRAVAAWDCLSEAVVRFGHNASVCFDDGLINAAVRREGGWSRICGLPEHEFDVWIRKSFIATYSMLAREGCSEDQARYLPGDHELKNHNRIGSKLPGSDKVYRGETIQRIGSRYPVALPAPEPQPRRIGFAPKLKTVGGENHNATV